MRNFLCLCTSILLLFACETYAQADPLSQDNPSGRYEVAGPGYTLRMPLPVETRITKNVSTPWGKATETEHVAKEGYNVLYIFRVFEFAPSRSLPPAKLKQVRSYFLRNRKCVARDNPQAPVVWKNPQGKPWQQTFFTGHCAAPEQFMVLTAIAEGNVYQLQVVQPLRANPSELTKAMAWMVDHSTIVSKIPQANK